MSEPGDPRRSVMGSYMYGFNNSAPSITVDYRAISDSVDGRPDDAMDSVMACLLAGSMYNMFQLVTQRITWQLAVTDTLLNYTYRPITRYSRLVYESYWTKEDRPDNDRRLTAYRNVLESALSHYHNTDRLLESRQTTQDQLRHSDRRGNVAILDYHRHVAGPAGNIEHAMVALSCERFAEYFVSELWPHLELTDQIRESSSGLTCTFEHLWADKIRQFTESALPALGGVKQTPDFWKVYHFDMHKVLQIDIVAGMPAPATESGGMIRHISPETLMRRIRAMHKQS